MKKIFLAFLIAAGITASFFAYAQNAYTQKPVKVVVPFPPGGPYDLIARLIGQRLSSSYGYTIIVENRAGAGGTIGADFVAKSKPDGLTLLVGGFGPNAVAPIIFSKTPYNPINAFEPIVEVLRSPNVLLVGPDFRANSIADVTKIAKEGDLAYASAGVGTSPHLIAELYAQTAGVKLTAVPYKGDSPALVAVISGEAPMYFASASNTASYVNSGKVRALAVTGSRRLPALPNVPTMAEAGVKQFDATAWFGFFAPAKTPTAIIDALNKQINSVLEDKTLRDQLTGNGAAEIVGGSSNSFGIFVQSEISRWKKVVDAAKISAD